MTALSLSLAVLEGGVLGSMVWITTLTHGHTCPVNPQLEDADRPSIDSLKATSGPWVLSIIALS